MKNGFHVFVFCALFLAPGARGALGQGTQTDWSGGPGEGGPVASFGDRFDTGDLAWGSVPGALTLGSVTRATFPRHVILGEADGPHRLAVGDVTGDGYDDVILSDPIISPFNPDSLRGGVYVWKNDGAGHWTRTVITEEFYGAWYVGVVDLDKDGDRDVIASAFYGEIDPPPPPPATRNGRFAWFENVDGAGEEWVKREIGELFWGANHAAAADVDGDGDLDFIGCSTLTDGGAEQEADVVWFENRDGQGENWIQHDVSGDFNDAFEVCPVDVDLDEDVDLLVSGYDRFEWFENLGGGASWIRHGITPTITGAGFFDVGDLDGDGDIDFVGTGVNTSVLVAWMNDGTGLVWDAYVVGPFSRGYNVDLADVDGDGDLDVAGGREPGVSTGQLFYAENLGNGTAWSPHTVEFSSPRNPWVKIGDVDRDGKPELVASFEDVYDVGYQLADYTLTDFVSAGTLTSSVLDGGATAGWGAVTWDADVPTGASLTWEVRGSQDPGDLGTFVTVPSSGTPLGALLDPSVRYVQYRVSCGSGGPDVSPIVREVGIETNTPTGVNDTGGRVTTLVSRVRPNPTRAGAVLAYDLPSSGPVSFDVFTVSGRSVFRRDEGEQRAGRHEVSWDGRDDRGAPVAPGVYFVRVRTDAGEAVARLVRLR